MFYTSIGLSRSFFNNFLTNHFKKGYLFYSRDIGNILERVIFMARGVLHIPGYIHFGEGALEVLKNIKGKKAMIVTGGSSMKKNGFIDQVEQYLKEAGLDVDIFDGVEENPSVETVQKGAERMRAFEPDWIVAIGGGSSMDAAKGMWGFYEHPELSFEDIIEPGSLPELRHKAKFIGIPSTSGTASEITAFSVITDTHKHIKYPLVSDYIVPDIAIVDPALPSKMPAHVTANTGMDVVAHATEALVSTAANDYTDALAIHALKLVFRYLKDAYTDPNNALAREKMHNASTMAGMAFTSASLGLIHSLAHKIGGEFGITHGLANAILLPYITQFNRKATDKVDWIEKELGVENYPQAVRELALSVGIPTTFREVEEQFGFNEEKFKAVLDEMSKNAYADPCTLTNPRESNPDVVKMIYESAYYGKDIED